MLFSLIHLWTIHPGGSSAAKDLLSSLEKWRWLKALVKVCFKGRIWPVTFLLTGEVSFPLLTLLHAACGNNYKQSVCRRNTISALKFYALQLWTVKLWQASTRKQLDSPVDEASPAFYICTCLIYHKVRISGKWISHCINTQKPAAILARSVIESHEIITHIP